MTMLLGGKISGGKGKNILVRRKKNFAPFIGKRGGLRN